MNDLRFAFRLLAKSPGFTAVAVLTLALGIGLSTSSFSTANVFLLRMLPYPESERLVRIFRTTRQSLQLPHAPANMLTIRESVTSFSAFAICNGDKLALGEPGRPAEQVSGMTVTADFFDVLGVQPKLGRGFVPGEDQPGNGQVAVITHRAWMRRYGGDAGVLGRSVRLSGLTFTIVGVLPDTFEAPLVWGPAEFIVPLMLAPEFRSQRTTAWMSCAARLKPGVSLRHAQAELDTIAAGLAREFPNENGGDGLRVVPLHDSNMDGVTRILLWLMTGLSLTMLLIACANLASLQIARALGRSREFAVRSALGGSRRQLMLPLLVESVLLALIGGAGGLIVAAWENAIVGSFLVINNEDGFRIPIDGRVFAFAAVSAIISGLAFGLAPAWLASRAPAAEALKEGSRSATGTPAHQRLKRMLIVAELALALALVGGAASFGVGARKFSRRELGWRVDGVFTGYVAMAYNRYPEDAKLREFHRSLLERLAAIPGVERAALATNLPFYSIGRVARMVIEGEAPQERGREPTAEAAAVSDDFFATLEIPLKQGTLFPAILKADDPLVVVVNESFARRFWPDGSAIGRRVRYVESEKWMEIVGVVGDVRMAVRSSASETRFQVYRPLIQAPSRSYAITLRGAAAPETFSRPVRQIVAALDPDLPVARAGVLRAQIDRNLSNISLVIVNLGLSGGMGLLIAGVGLFGVISQLIAQRTRDIGVRIALGAQHSDIVRMIMGEGVVLLAIGIGVGLPLFYALETLVRRTMPEMPMPGLWLLATNLIVLAATMLLACYLPARRAMRVDPIEALRAE